MSSVRILRTTYSDRPACIRGVDKSASLALGAAKSSAFGAVKPTMTPAGKTA
jgi:hypothetical protein